MSTSAQMKAIAETAVLRMNKYLYDGEPLASVTVTLQASGWWTATVRDRYDAVYAESDPMPSLSAALEAVRMKVAER